MLCWLNFRVRLQDENLIYFYDGANWSPYTDGKIGGQSTVVNSGAFGGQTNFELAEEELTLVGSSTDSTIVIPDRSIVFAVTTRTIEAITGAASYDCGIAGDTGKFGDALNIAFGSINSGVIGPTAFYVDTAVQLTANGSDFIGGKVRITIHYMMCTPSLS